MSYTVVYEPDYARLLPAILIECRATIPAIANQIGSVIKSYNDSHVALIGSNSLFYKIETELGAVAAVFSIDINSQNKTANLVINLTRPAFVQYNNILSNTIINFIVSGGWQGDYLF